LSKKEKVRHSRTPVRQKSPRFGPKNKAARTHRSDKVEREILALVRSGVERFILKNATVEDFLRTIRVVGDDQKAYSHQLTRSVFSRIVREAIKKRNVRKSKSK
jgi:DNA-binding NarL/FixJ family response regulator